MFSHASTILCMVVQTSHMHWGCSPPPQDRCTLSGWMSPPECSARRMDASVKTYGIRARGTSYWNAYLMINFLANVKEIVTKL